MTVRKVKLTLSFVLFLTSFLFAQQADEIIGKYHLPNNLDIEIFEYNKKYYGKIIALNGFEGGQTKDINNPDKSKCNELLIGEVIIKNLEYNEDENEWINGSIYAPDKAMVLSLKITEIKQNEIEVVASKYLFWRTLKWEKIKVANLI